MLKIKGLKLPMIADEIVTGNVFFVDSGGSKTLDDPNYGGDPEKTFATIDYAIGQCTANNGDYIIVMPGHTETTTAAADTVFDVAGVTVIGIGNGNDRPTITFGTSTLTDWDITAANIRISNIRFTVAVDSPAALIDVGAAQFQLDKCQFLGTASYQPDIWVDLDANADYCKILNNEFIDATAGAASAVKIAAALTDLEIAKNRFWGDYSDACVHNPTGNVATQLNIHHNIMTNLQAGDHCIELVSACTGVIAYNTVNNTSLAAAGGATAIDPGSCFCIENYGSDGVGDVSGVLNPAVDS